MKTMHHRQRFPRLATTALLGLTLLGGPAEAKKPQAVPPRAVEPAPLSAFERSGLTWEEYYCQQMGALAFKGAEARDVGITYLTLVSTLRQPPRPTTEVGRSQALMNEQVIRLVYESPHLTPATIRQTTELGCLEGGVPPLDGVRTLAQ
jgi:hypothetical protein